MTLPAPDTHSQHICRSETGALNMTCHERRARRLRAQATQQWLNGLGHLLLRFWNCLRDCARRMAIRRELATLDKRTLKDIGLAPADLPAIADGSFLADNTRRQRSIGRCLRLTSTPHLNDKDHS